MSILRPSTSLIYFHNAVSRLSEPLVHPVEAKLGRKIILGKNYRRAKKGRFLPFDASKTVRGADCAGEKGKLWTRSEATDPCAGCRNVRAFSHGKKYAWAGSRTRIECLEGIHANRYTTYACVKWCLYHSSQDGRAV